MLIQKFEAEYGNTMKVSDAAKELHSHPSHVRELCREGKIPAVQIGKRWRIPTAQFAAFLEGGFND